MSCTDVGAGMAPRDPTQRFDDRVEDYVRHRPDYPPALVAHLRAHGWLAPHAVVADIGAGTGISSAMFLDAGCEVHAVEPNAPMRAAAQAQLGARAAFHAVDGRAEATTLADASVDLVAAAQAFHWFDMAAVRGEWRRILRADGVAAVFWNSRRVDGNAFLEGYERLQREFGTDYAQVAERHQDDATMRAWFGSGLRDVTEFPHAQSLDFDALRGRLLSSSHAPRPGHPRHDAMIARLRELFDATARDGRVDLVYRTRLFVGAP